MIEVRELTTEEEKHQALLKTALAIQIAGEWRPGDNYFTAAHGMVESIVALKAADGETSVWQLLGPESMRRAHCQAIGEEFGVPPP